MIPTSVRSLLGRGPLRLSCELSDEQSEHVREIINRRHPRIIKHREQGSEGMHTEFDAMEREIANLQKQIDAETAKVVGGDESFSKKTTQYEQFMLDSEVAKQHLALAITTLENAHAQAVKTIPNLGVVAGRHRALFVVK